jgi:thiol-disulfide isomerase/thioredoxin
LASVAWAQASVEEQIAAITKENEEQEKRFHDELVEARRDFEKISKANKDHREVVKDQESRLKAIIKANGENPAVVEGLITYADSLRYPFDDELARIALRHRDDPSMGRLCFAIRYRYRAGEQWAKQILNAVKDNHPDRNVRGQAVFALGENYRNAALPYGEQPSADRQAPLFEQATKYYQQAMDEYATSPTPDGEATLGEKAKHELARIRNLPQLKVGGTAPPIAGKDLDGNELRLEDYRGKVVVVIFWGTWCGPCMAMVPHEKEIFERYREKPFALLGVNCGDKLETARETVKTKEMRWASWWDGEQIRGPIETDYNVPHWPSVYVIDDKGKFVAIDPRGEELDSAIETALTGVKL